ncbi:MAG: cysteine desulfurase family protein [Solitalea-like symbiont of Tyrophagus putrescentiae]
MHKRYTYFDNASTTMLFDNLISEFYSLEKKYFANSSSSHELGKLALNEIECSRRLIADIFKTKEDNIYFVSGASEANNTIISAALNLGIRTIITSALEHPSILEPIKYLVKYNDFNIFYVNNDTNGLLDYNHLEQLLTKHKNEKCLVSIMHANNEIGNLNNIQCISKLCKDNNALFHSDIVQTAGYYDIFPEELKIDFMSLSAHKFHGPKNVGAMYINSKINIIPLIKGGKQEMGMRAGTQSASTILLMAKALEQIYSNKSTYNNYILGLYNHCLNRLSNELKNVSINGNASNSLHKILNISISGKQSTESLLINLDTNNICVSSGSACSSGALEPSHVLKAINYNSENANIRISFSINNTISEVDYFIETLKSIYNEI